MNEIKTKIEIHASKELIWKILVDFEHYPNWNKFLPRIWGFKNGEVTPAAGFWEKVYIHKNMYLPLPMKIINFEKNRELSFWGRAPWIFAIFSFGYHIFTLESLDENRCIFQHRYINSGLVMDIAFRLSFIRNEIMGVQQQMNYDLKLRSESSSSSFLKSSQ